MQRVERSRIIKIGYTYKILISMNKGQKFIETKEYKRFAEFCDTCIKYKYLSICTSSYSITQRLVWG